MMLQRLLTRCLLTVYILTLVTWKSNALIRERVPGGLEFTKGKVIGAHLLKKKFGGVGLVLAAPLLTGKFPGRSGFGRSIQSNLSPRNLFTSPLDRRIDGVFGELLAANPFKSSPRAKKSGVFLEMPLSKKILLKSRLKKRTGITSQLSQLTDALGLGNQIAENFRTTTRNRVQGIGNSVDRTIGTVQTAQRLGIDLTEFLLDSNPETANLKNLVFTTMLFGLYLDSNLNARKSVLASSRRSIGEISNIFEPIGVESVLNPIDGVFQQSIRAIDDILSIPQTIFKSSSSDSLGPIGNAFRRNRELWESITADVAKFRDRGYTVFGEALRRAEESRVTGAADDSIQWLDRFRDNSQQEIDERVLSAESKLNELVNKPTDAINQALNMAIQSAVDNTNGLNLFDQVSVLEQVKQNANAEMGEILSSFASGLGFYKNGQEIASDIISAGIKDVLGVGGDRNLVQRAEVGSGPLAGVFSSALSLSRDATSQFINQATDSADRLDALVESVIKTVNDPEIGSLIQQSVGAVDVKSLVDVLDILPSPNL